MGVLALNTAPFESYATVFSVTEECKQGITVVIAVGPKSVKRIRLEDAVSIVGGVDVGLTKSATLCRNRRLEIAVVQLQNRM